MAYIVAPQVLLEAVNEVLSSIGSSPVNTLDDDLNIDVINAKNLLMEVSRKIQARGWSFNHEDNVLLRPDSDTKRVPFLSSYLRVSSEGYTLISKSGYFFDLATRTDTFPDGITCSIVREIPFEELPYVAQKYITARASRLFQMRYLGSTDIDQTLRVDEGEAYAELIDYDLEVGNYNIFQDDTYISGMVNGS